MLEAQLLDGLGCVHPLTADPGLLVGKQRLADAVGVVGLKQLSFLLVKPHQHGFGIRNLLSRQLSHHGNVRLDCLADALALLIAELHRGVVALHGFFHGCHPVVALGAVAFLATAANEVVVEPAVAFDLRVEQPRPALAAIQTAAQIVEVPPRAFAADALGSQQVLDFLKRLLIN